MVEWRTYFMVATLVQFLQLTRATEVTIHNLVQAGEVEGIRLSFTIV